MALTQYIGWQRNEKSNTDKVWGIILLQRNDHAPNVYVSFWGRRGTKLQTKMITGSTYCVSEMFRKKLRSGYTEVSDSRLNEVYPEFQQDLEKTAFWATFKI